jgi:hypothetical protein
MSANVSKPLLWNICIHSFGTFAHGFETFAKMQIVF